MALEIRPCTPDAWQTLVPILAHSFNFAAAGWNSFRERIGDENLRCAYLDGEMVGGLGIYPMGQYFGGRSVPMGGLAGVGVAPHVRGRGVAKALVVRSLRDLRDQGRPLCGLYPASLHVYRSCGFEQPGDRMQYQVELQTLTPGRYEVPVVSFDCNSESGLSELRARYQPAHGNLDRSGAIWQRITRGVIGTRRSWLIGNDGYVILVQSPEDGPHYDLDVLDFHAPSAATARTLLALFAAHRSLADNVRWFGGATDSLVALVPEPRWKIPMHYRWMLRMCDVDGAFVARGYSPDAAGELHLDIHDALLPENSGKRMLRVSGGKAEVVPGGTGAMRCDVRALGPLFSGYWPARTLCELGWMSADPATCAIAAKLFAGPIPWMREMY